MEEIQGTIDDISRAFNGGWRFARVKPHGTVVGHIPPGIRVGDLCLFRGYWKEHDRYGRQFQAEHIMVETPRDVQGIKRYLDRHFDWVGPTIAARLVKEFGEILFDVIENSPELLSKVPGLTPDRAKQIHETYLGIREDRDLDVFFSTHGITLNLAAKFVGIYGSKKRAIQVIRDNPYRLSDDVYGIGFKRSDQIALSLGIKRDSRFRINSGVKWVLTEAESGEGHCYLPILDLEARAGDMLEVRVGIQEAVTELAAAGEIVHIEENNGLVYLPRTHAAEQLVAAKLSALAAAWYERPVAEHDPEVYAEMDGDQRRALDLATSSRVSVVTGGPGVGKTYTVNRVIRSLGLPDQDIALCAPTGKAAKRMTELCGRPACTIHRLLEYSAFEQAFMRNHAEPLSHKAVIVDETSMVDIHLAAALLDAIDPSQTQLVFVGDVDQLPAVGPGRVLADMIDSGRIPTARLKTLHRQAAKSLINRNAQRINSGEDLTFSGGEDMAFIQAETTDRIRELMPEIVHKISGNLGFSLDEIQVLCPQKKGPIGARELNRVLQPLLNRGGEKVEGTGFLTGDRVIQLRNNYKLGIFNGDLGKVLGSDKESISIDFDGTEIDYPRTNLDELDLAYALTIHKGQGSEYPAVIVPVHTTNYVMLKRNLIYTAVTRGKRLVVLVGTQKALKIAVKTVDSHQRYSGLKNLIGGNGNGA